MEPGAGEGERLREGEGGGNCGGGRDLGAGSADGLSEALTAVARRGAAAARALGRATREVRLEATVKADMAVRELVHVGMGRRFCNAFPNPKVPETHVAARSAAPVETWVRT